MVCARREAAHGERVMAAWRARNGPAFERQPFERSADAMVNLTHSEMATPRRLAAASAAFRSAMVNRKVSVSAFRSDFGRSGRPIFFGMNLSLFAVDRESLLRIVGHQGGRRDPKV
jgi:hypothetical protein